MLHKPVLLKEVLELLNLEQGMTALDGTLGGGGHAGAILEKIGSSGRFIGLDQDPLVIERCKANLGQACQTDLIHSNFRDVKKVLADLKIESIDAAMIDIGFSSDQLEDADRGFSFEREGPLDMRMNPHEEVQAKDLVRDLSQDDLEQIFKDLGEERWARRIARAICDERRKTPIETTTQLASIVQRAVPFKKKSGTKKRSPRRFHPATRVFQALRIAVNDELGALRDALDGLWNHLSVGGRLAVISFHSLEDRIVKRKFLSWKQEGLGHLVTRKPLTATREEILSNRRSRSAKLRVIERIA